MSDYDPGPLRIRDGMRRPSPTLTAAITDYVTASGRHAEAAIRHVLDAHGLTLDDALERVSYATIPPAVDLDGPPVIPLPTVVVYLDGVEAWRVTG